MNIRYLLLRMDGDKLIVLKLVLRIIVNIHKHPSSGTQEEKKIQIKPRIRTNTVNVGFSRFEIN